MIHPLLILAIGYFVGVWVGCKHPLIIYYTREQYNKGVSDAFANGYKKRAEEEKIIEKLNP